MFELVFLGFLFAKSTVNPLLRLDFMAVQQTLIRITG